MHVAILGYGKEGKSAEKYFKAQGNQVEIFDNFTNDELKSQDFAKFDLVLRSPSVPLQAGWSSMTKYFFEHCPCPIIGVTGTKGKGTTCSMITTMLQALNKKVWLIGNIGNPALDILDEAHPNDIVVYEMSSFQLWDLEKSPHVAVVLPIEPDHLNVHKDFTDYVNAKSNIARHQTEKDYCIYYSENVESTKIGEMSSGTKIAYPVSESTELKNILDSLTLRGQHNRENAQAALLAVTAICREDLNNLLQKYGSELKTALHSFQGLPHRLQFLRELNRVKYYDDNFCTNVASLEVALKAFPEENIILIAGGRDKTSNADLPEIAKLVQQHTKGVILIGESGHELKKMLPDDNAILVDSLVDAVNTAKGVAENMSEDAIILMSPSAASFDMFENVYDRGAQFQKIVAEL